MAGLLKRRRPVRRPEDVALGGQLDERLAAVRAAEARLREAELAGGDTAVLRRELDALLARAVESAEARYNLVTAGLESLPRVKQLAMLVRPDVVSADRVRREIALARTHYRVAQRDDLGAVRLAAVPPSVGTHATHLATHLEGH